MLALFTRGPISGKNRHSLKQLIKIKLTLIRRPLPHLKTHRLSLSAFPDLVLTFPPKSNHEIVKMGKRAFDRVFLKKSLNGGFHKL